MYCREFERGGFRRNTRKGVPMNSRQRIAYENPVTFGINRKEQRFVEMHKLDGLTVKSVLTIDESNSGAPSIWSAEAMVVNDQGESMLIRTLSPRDQSNLRLFVLELVDGVGIRDWQIIEYPDSIRVVKQMSEVEAEGIGSAWAAEEQRPEARGQRSVRETAVVF
jgi:hypothetical protein